MKLELIICTYMRPTALCTLLESVQKQTLVPDYVTIVDGSTNDETGEALRQRQFAINLRYHKVPDSHRGLTRQRNYGVARVAPDAEFISFLDDDTVVEPDYFEEIISTFRDNKDALGVGGYIKEKLWKRGAAPSNSLKYYQADGWYRVEPNRVKVRKALGLGPPQVPCVMPPESNGRSIGFLPPSGLTYPVEYFMGGVATYRRDVFEKVQFSEYFDGYGLYEDLDFCLRLSRYGPLFINTAACLYHYHEPSGRPNRYKYGKMVIRNGWYVWRVKYIRSTIPARLKWWAIAMIQAIFLLNGVFQGSTRSQSITEFAGRLSGMLSLILSPPRVER